MAKMNTSKRQNKAQQLPLFLPKQSIQGSGSGEIEGSIDDIDSEEIKQFNNLVIAQHDMNLYERRIFISVLKNLPEINAEDPIQKDSFSVWVNIHQLIGESELAGQSAFSELKKATQLLIKHICKIDMGNRVLQIALLSSAEYYKREGKIELRFDVKLLPYLLRIKNEFEPQYLSELMQFQSRYSQCFYELFKRESRKGSVVYIELVRLRTLLGIEEIYERYNDLKRKVIYQAQKDLVHYADVAFRFEEKKVKGKVEGIYFYLNQMLGG
ncbi:replication initiation protein [Xanthocytophaga agilis]|uniref:Replication initiation protein n=1 Tax=Xanthocytophaga agilis TaxID=3048010 RepID=A0AAE3R9D3_9BACT|nr:replication initiation protein [Xanthocytophaga agilis]MDJ1506306.1 replication initiation protein [Xanthocytophaga agilis]